jgi:hypothetical protein
VIEVVHPVGKRSDPARSVVEAKAVESAPSIEATRPTGATGPVLLRADGASTDSRLTEPLCHTRGA